MPILMTKSYVDSVYVNIRERWSIMWSQVGVDPDPTSVWGNYSQEREVPVRPMVQQRGTWIKREKEETTREREGEKHTQLASCILRETETKDSRSKKSALCTNVLSAQGWCWACWFEITNLHMAAVRLDTVITETCCQSCLASGLIRADQGESAVSVKVENGWD